MTLFFLSQLKEVACIFQFVYFSCSVLLLKLLTTHTCMRLLVTMRCTSPCMSFLSVVLNVASLTWQRTAGQRWSLVTLVFSDQSHSIRWCSNWVIKTSVFFFSFSVVEGYFYIVHKSKHLTVNNGLQPGND